MGKIKDEPQSGMLASQWADGMPDREARVANVNSAMDAAIKTLRANLKFNSTLLTLDTLAKLDDLQREIRANAKERGYR